MSLRRGRWILWLVLFATVPLPYFAIEVGREPGVQLLVFAAATGAMAATEPSGMTAFVTGLFWAQALIYAGLLHLLAWLIVRSPTTARGRALLVAGLAVVLATASLFPIYVTPFSRSGVRSNLVGVFR